jgi:ADP-heptose:LPS heptosyltransferase
VFNSQERLVAEKTFQELKSIQKKSKTIIFQPFGRGAKVDGDHIMDEESRSLSPATYLMLCKKLSMQYNMVFFGEPEFQLKADTFAAKYTADLRQWGALIEKADYFVGCDSVGQHIARAVGTRGTVIFGSTFPVNTSYPDYFQIIDNGQHKKYSPIRIAGLDTMLANRLNESSMVFTDAEVHEIYTKIVKDIERKGK